MPPLGDRVCGEAAGTKDAVKLVLESWPSTDLVHHRWTISLPMCGAKPERDPASPASHHRETHSPSAPVPLTPPRCQYATSPPESPSARPERSAASPTPPLSHRRHRAA